MASISNIQNLMSQLEKTKGQPLFQVNPENAHLPLSGFQYHTVQCIEGKTANSRILFDFGTMQSAFDAENVLPARNGYGKVRKDIPRTASSGMEQVSKCLKKFADCFMWKASDITGNDPAIAVHKISVYPEVRPVKQKLRMLKTEWSLKIKEEVVKQLENKFIEPIAYPTWLANIVPVPKKDGKVRMCVDYRDLNKACPKDDFPLPHCEYSNFEALKASFPGRGDGGLP
ncbi:uncharacterized protein LOC119371514 [Jatropha curcas]|uniref:uncharacterized protein LOC119371514 n=1 Tax=Jatropha curcas TaxID=180498 RepID=UPI00189464A7|nr:uncharacterized protein LOC119371514 [Jatropha curcas]